ncbi:sugar ABC transporter [Herbaspirillum rubrisubalbicans]|uniref:sugar ABC transporter n=1 Tax=Herbaspirillum rubrisubalbicans TaxID=80842 RepID=UPI0015C52B70|nr:sugar ABC transporter [Herbaspirillum rubrisubalbicans]NQE47797.1 aBC-type sugar transport system protein [Herbaspirillum rubrisubalbicans]
MIYTVECSFADPLSEAEWNDFYSLEKLPALISVSGFHTSQRFKALSKGCPTYLALHTIDDLEVLLSEEYQRKGGGNFARWQQHITHWHRNLYETSAAAPAVLDGAYLLLSAAGPDPLRAMGLSPRLLNAVALEQSPPQRWMAVWRDPIDIDHAALPEGLHLYTPMTAQLSSGCEPAIHPAN